MTLKLIAIITYIVFLLITYIFIVKRLWFLNKRHIEHTQVEHLRKNYLRVVKIIWFLMVVLAIISVIIFLKLF